MRPSVSVVMPFAGDLSAARLALATLTALDVAGGDQLILADNEGLACDLLAPSGAEIVAAVGERSPSHARNAGARHAHADWILFIDADCRAPADLLDRYFAVEVSDDVGALVGEVVPAGASRGSVAERYGVARSFLSQRAHLAHGYLPRAAAANLLVRRTAFEQLGGFYEGLRAAEDTDFSWRLQQAGWRLELRAEAYVEHRYRSSVSDLRRQWRGYAAGRAWLARRYPGFTPEPAVARAARRLRRSGSHGTAPLRDAPRPAGPSRPSHTQSRRDRAAFFALDGLLAGEELAGLVLSNRPRRAASPAGVQVVLVAERFPAPDDPLVEFALSVDGARVEAAVRPPRVDPAAAALRIDYREDDGALVRALALLALLFRHPGRCLRDRTARLRRRRGRLNGTPAPSLTALAPAVRRLQREGGGVRVHALGASEQTRAVAARMAALSETRHELHLPLPGGRR
jgi:Glycosyl transferase family group 2